ncbi:uncharacterized protein LOC143476739 isoform X2 [Brachyhypopomus gauderio]
MDLEDPIAAKFKKLIESVLVTTTADIVKVFTEVLLETRVEISRSWREIDDLKQQLQESEEQRKHAILRHQVTCSLKKEDGGMSGVTHPVSISDTSNKPEGRGRKILENATVEEMDTRQSCLAVNGPTTPQTSPGTSGVNLPVNTPNQNNNGQSTKTMFKRKYVKKKIASTCSISSTHKLRDRHLLSTQRHCLCCSLDQFSLKVKHRKTNAQVVPHTYSCKQCGKRFHDRMQFKHHKCIHKCNRCGHKFTSLENMTIHRRSVDPATRPYPYCCSLCGDMIATQCGWNVHKRTHANSDHSQNAQDAPKPSQTLTGPKDLNTKVEVRLERISDAQLEAALSPKGSLLRDETTSLSSLDVSVNLPTGVETSGLNRNVSAPSTCTNINTPVLTEELPSQSMTKIVEECMPSTSTIGMDKNVKGADIQTASAQIQPEEDGSDSLTAQNMASVECENGCSTKGANSSLRKGKKSDCNHGVHNDVFPVEKILGWRNAKGKNEVKVKWMPCSL